MCCDCPLLLILFVPFVDHQLERYFYFPTWRHVSDPVCYNYLNHRSLYADVMVPHCVVTLWLNFWAQISIVWSHLVLWRSNSFNTFYIRFWWVLTFRSKTKSLGPWCKYGRVYQVKGAQNRRLTNFNAITHMILFYSILLQRGLKYVHSAGVVHRDLVRTLLINVEKTFTCPHLLTLSSK